MKTPDSIPTDRMNRLARQIRAGKYSWIAKTVDELVHSRAKMLEFKSECDVDGIQVSEAIAEALYAVETERHYGYSKVYSSRHKVRALKKDEKQIEKAINALVEAQDSPIFDQVDFSTAFERLIREKTGKSRTEFYAERLFEIAEQADDHRARLKALDRALELAGKREAPQEKKEEKLTFIMYHDNRQQTIQKDGIVEGEILDDAERLSGNTFPG